MLRAFGAFQGNSTNSTNNNINKKLNYPIIKLDFENLLLDEPTCLQLAYALPFMKNLKKLNLKNCRVGPRGGLLILNRIVSNSIIQPLNNEKNIEKNSAGGVSTAARTGNRNSSVVSKIAEVLQLKNNFNDQKMTYVKGLMQNLEYVDFTNCLLGLSCASDLRKWIQVRGKVW